MNRKSLIEMMVALVATAALGGCVSAPAPQPTAVTPQGAARGLDMTRNAWAECVRAAIPRLDHPESSSEVVAHAAMNSCSDKYADVVRALSRTLAPSCGRDSDCTRVALAKAEHEATRAATEAVVTSRVQTAGAQVLKCQ
jgi:hypothetical protein